MKNKRKLLIIPLTFLLLGTLTISAEAQDSKVNYNDPQGTDYVKLVDTKNRRGFFTQLQDFFRPNKPQTAKAPTIDKNVIRKFQNKASDLSADAIVLKRDVVSRAKEIVRGDYILEEKDAFSIVYVPTPGIFFVDIHKKPINDVKQEAEKWFRDQGFTQDQLCGLGINFAQGSVELSNSEINSLKRLPTGCR